MYKNLQLSNLLCIGPHGMPATIAVCAAEAVATQSLHRPAQAVHNSVAFENSDAGVCENSCAAVVAQFVDGDKRGCHAWKKMGFTSMGNREED
jgi:hypothetical protein